MLASFDKEGTALSENNGLVGTANLSNATKDLESKTPSSLLGRIFIKPMLEFDLEVRNTLTRFSARVMAFYILAIIAGVIFLTITRNPEVFVLNDETQNVIAQFYNLIIWMLVPCLLGTLGAVARVMMAGLEVGASKKLVLSSGMMAAFSWLGIKSKVFLALVAPYVVSAPNTQPEEVAFAIGHIGSEFYSMALVAVAVGMFASNIYIFINQRVEALTREAEQARKPPSDT
jgi:hypothetical protein